VGALAAFAAAVDVVTLEFENIPLATARYLHNLLPFFPAPDALAVTQVRTAEKSLANRLGFGAAPWRPVRSYEELETAVAEIGSPAVLKTNRFGYDGKGQIRIDRGADLAAAWRGLASDDAILEGFIDFTRELSVVIARGQNGAVALYPAVENRHRHHILWETIAPAPIAQSLAAEAQAIAAAIAAAMDYVGVLAVEMFETRDGRLLVNELAPRPHNSGHWTIDACYVSQFEQLVRTLVGLPLGPTHAHAGAVMHNLIGENVNRWREAMADPLTKLHLYGKKQARPGRKMGHTTRLIPLR
jgi:5-(carboxyamino)imidazole ribonucleotide synthase